MADVEKLAVTIEKAAEAMSCSRAMIEKHIAGGRLPCFRLGDPEKGDRRVKVSHLNKLIDELVEEQR